MEHALEDIIGTGYGNIFEVGGHYLEFVSTKIQTFLARFFNIWHCLLNIRHCFFSKQFRRCQAICLAENFRRDSSTRLARIFTIRHIYPTLSFESNSEPVPSQAGVFTTRPQMTGTV